MKDRIKNVLGHVLEIDPKHISEDFKQENCEKWDSLLHLSLAVEIESEFGLSLHPEEIGQMIDFNSIYQVVNGRE